jgi:hypothetical protein
MVTSTTSTGAGNATTVIEVGSRSIRQHTRLRRPQAVPAKSTGGLLVAMSEDGLPTGQATEPTGGPAILHTGPDWQSAVNRIRGTADWITKAFVAIAALLIGTGPLLIRVTGLSVGPRALAAGVGAVAALFGVGLVIQRATEVMLPETTDLAELVTAARGPLQALRSHVESPLGQRIYLDRDITEVRGLIDAMDGWQRTVELLGQYAQQVNAFEAQDPRPEESTLPRPLQDPAARASIATTLAGARARLQQLNLRAAELVRQSVYVEVRDTFTRARRMMLVGGALTAAGVATYVAALGVQSGPSNTASATAAGSPELSIETLSWNRTSPDDAVPIAEVRRSLGLSSPSCDTVPVVVRAGTGAESDPWLLTTVGGGSCHVPPRQFQVDNRYAMVSSEPVTTFRLDPNTSPTGLWGYVAVSFVIGVVVVGAPLLVWRLTRNRAPGS